MDMVSRLKTFEIFRPLKSYEIDALREVIKFIENSFAFNQAIADSNMDLAYDLAMKEKQMLESFTIDKW